MAKRVVGVVAAVLLTVCLCGCATVAGVVVGGATTALWLSGKLSYETGNSHDIAVEAVRKALDSLDMNIVKETTTERLTQFISVYKDGSKTWIDVRPLPGNRSRIEIRVGVRGDKTASSEILDKIKQYL